MLKYIYSGLFKILRSFIVCFVCIMQMQFVQSDDIFPSLNLGKGIIYLKEKRVIKNIRLKEIKTYWIIYQKDESLHDRMMDEIVRIEFPDAKPEPLIMEFENNKPVLKIMTFIK